MVAYLVFLVGRILYKGNDAGYQTCVRVINIKVIRKMSRNMLYCLSIFCFHG